MSVMPSTEISLRMMGIPAFLGDNADLDDGMPATDLPLSLHYYITVPDVHDGTVDPVPTRPARGMYHKMYQCPRQDVAESAVSRKAVP